VRAEAAADQRVPRIGVVVVVVLLHGSSSLLLSGMN
jgi:hypothetical protein